ncbi:MULTISPECIES: type III secretion protein HrpF [Pantoea]|uniref:HrpF protein n=1 Tax=Candidatus Pantoea floridensis TaxID=1938870 RepID=A0A286C023_9GAMM|nr:MULTISPECIES: type III secretion protein HrpF [Pantoea]PIF22247.1 HrpF protein [Enterobacteriaceae bacterium JKS000233]PXW18471.1 HrpF protein [Pantoea sp. JKS000250]SOD39754.1 HrpF protein [Pantoea floridensis]
MANMLDIQHRLDHQLSDASHEVLSLAQSMQGQSPTMDDLFTFKNALRKEAVSNLADNQLSSLKHNLTRSIIESIS